MLLQRFYDAPLAQASYLIACQATGEALVVDPVRDVAPYLAAARTAGVRITHVTETHIHADFVSGARELAAGTGATLLLSGEGGEGWQYGYALDAGATLLHGGDQFRVGNVRIDVLHTPGHTPEHLTFLVTDGATADAPMGACTGDFVFVGDVGRPDLLERAAGQAGTMDAAARALHASLRQLDTLPDWLQLWPGHGAGSACGKSLGAVPQTTLGYERRFNWALQPQSEDAFVATVLAGQPEPPPYFAHMKRVNRDGPPLLGHLRQPPAPLPHLAPETLPALLDAGALVIDTRPAPAHAARHVPGTINLPRGASLTTWAGWLLPYDRSLHLIAASETDAATAAGELARIGLDRVAGWYGPEALDAWAAAGRGLDAVPAIDVGALAAARADGATVIDVRNPSEWSAGHLPGVANVPLGHLPDRAAELPRDQPLVLHCQGGTRSAIAASVLRAQGFTNVTNLTGGYSAWRNMGGAIERE